MRSQRLQTLMSAGFSKGRIHQMPCKKLVPFPQVWRFQWHQYVSVHPQNIAAQLYPLLHGKMFVKYLLTKIFSYIDQEPESAIAIRPSVLFAYTIF